jgi:hypothetical protein
MRKKGSLPSELSRGNQKKDELFFLAKAEAITTVIIPLLQFDDSMLSA